MDDLTPEESEALIEAVARGIVPDGDDGFAEALTAAHISPAAPKGAVPSLAGPGGMTTAGFMRRTAVGASVGLIALVGVAAAGTAGVVLLTSNDGESEVIDVEEGEDAPVATTIAPTTTIAEPEAAESEDDPEASDRERGDEIEGVDASDGLDDEELELLCDAAVNHGEYVSSVAKDKNGDDDGESRGERVSEAAQSDCGKNDDADESGDDDEDEAEEGEGPSLHSDGPGNGNGKANGHSKNGKGNSEG